MPKLTAAEYLAHAIALSGKTQKEIATDAGYDKPNVLSMMKTGVTKIPVDRAPAIARACGVDPKIMLRIVMEEYHPDIWEVLADTMGDHITMSDEERALVAHHRAEGSSFPAA
ncbi:helix-turn-helix domain-containing protein [Mameliella sp.]|uniref:helix-turn-helix domain-containing protein n=1 Tax=Mameliella sp. TaxID=1924940 RepID=UPI003BABC59C